jgi:DNA-binding response OmpR family regulator
MNKRNKKKILIIEDEKILSEMYRDVFIQAGFEVLSAIESKQGLRLARKENPDLIVLDILLPGKNGISFLEKLKKDDKISSIPVVVFTNYDGTDTKKRAKELGVKDYLIKTSFTPKQFVLKIKSYFK